MLYGTYRFSCSLESPAILPAYKGSTFRGVFGHSLKKVVCALKRQDCTECLLKTRCIYTLVFETGLAKPPPEGARLAAAPHPFVIEPPATTRTSFAAGDDFDFNLILFGEVNHHLPYFIYAFDTMGRMGIGRKMDGKRGRFILETVSQNSAVIYDSKKQQIQLNGDLPGLILAESGLSQNGDPNQLKITLKTPLRLKYKNKLTEKLPFHILVRAMLRRTDALLRCWGDEVPGLDFKGLVARAEAVQTVSSNLRWFDWQRYSSRQNKKMLMGGLVGSVTYKGDLSEFIPLIDFCRKTHVGKQTAFGLGAFEMMNDE